VNRNLLCGLLCSCASELFVIQIEGRPTSPPKSPRSPQKSPTFPANPCIFAKVPSISAKQQKSPIYYAMHHAEEGACVCVCVCVFACACVCVCVCERERERECVCVCVRMCTCMLERDRENAREGVRVYVCMRACVCGKEREPSCPPASSRGTKRQRESLVRMYTRRKLRPYSALPSNHCTSRYKALRGWTHNIIHWLTRGMNWHRKKAARRDGCHRWRRCHVVRW